MFVLVIFNVSAITRLFTRFTEEIFTVLIGAIFIYISLDALWNIHLAYPYNKWELYPTRALECDCYEFPSHESLRVSNISNATNLGPLWDESVQNCTVSVLRKYVGAGCPKVPEVSHDVFLMSVILFFGTFLLCVYFKKIRKSKFFKSYVSLMAYPELLHSNMRNSVFLLVS